MLMINSRSAEQHSPNLPDPWSQFIISTSKDTLVSLFLNNTYTTISKKVILQKHKTLNSEHARGDRCLHK